MMTKVTRPEEAQAQTDGPSRAAVVRALKILLEALRRRQKLQEAGQIESQDDDSLDAEGA